MVIEESRCLVYLHCQNGLETTGSGFFAADSGDNEQTLVSWCKSGGCTKQEKIKVLRHFFKLYTGSIYASKGEHILTKPS